MNTPLLEIENVSAWYGTVQALHDVNMSVAKGEITGLIGLNGAGKTTLIKSILGLRSCKGKILFRGKMLEELSSSEHPSFLPERFDPPWFLTGIEFLRFSAKIFNHSIDEETVFKAADTLNLDRGALVRKVQTYSKGMRQKLGLMATVLVGSDFLILDEPMSGLDPRARRRVKELILKAKTEGQTIFMTSHILSDMDELCDKLFAVDNGRLVFSGTPKELKSMTKEENMEKAFLKMIDNYSIQDKAA